MYIDNANGEPEQCGFVITASTNFDTDNGRWKTEYIELWVTVNVVINPFKEAKP